MLMKQQLRDGHRVQPCRVDEPESRSWAHIRPAGGPICYHGDPGPCPCCWGYDPPTSSWMRTPRKQRPASKPRSTHTPLFRNNLFCSKAWDFDLRGVFSSCWSPDVLPAHPPPPPSQARPLESLSFPGFFGKGGCLGEGSRT